MNKQTENITGQICVKIPINQHERRDVFRGQWLFFLTRTLSGRETVRVQVHEHIVELRTQLRIEKLSWNIMRVISLGQCRPLPRSHHWPGGWVSLFVNTICADGIRLMWSHAGWVYAKWMNGVPVRRQRHSREGLVNLDTETSMSHPQGSELLEPIRWKEVWTHWPSGLQKPSDSPVSHFLFTEIESKLL